MISLAIPPAIRPGDTVSLVAPAGPIDPSALERAVAVLTQRGVKAKTYRDVTARQAYLAGTDGERVAELNAAFRDPGTTAVLPIRGGYGCIRLLERLDYAALSQRPKLICGFSDITALHAAVHQFAGVATFHTPNLQDGIGHIEGLDAEIAPTYWHTLTGETPDQAPALLSQAKTLVAGRAGGPLVGGNLAVWCSLIGTPFEPDTRGAVLLLEDVGEVPYRIDRLLAQLRMAGKFDGLAGVVLGQFTPGTADEFAVEELDQLWQDYFATLGVPVLTNFPVGHVRQNLPVPLGVPVELDADRGELNLDQAWQHIDASRA